MAVRLILPYDEPMAQLGQARRPAASRDKDDVLDIASKVIAERGFDKARFADVADEAGFAVSTLQYSFGAREDLLVQALEHTHKKELAALEAAVGNVEGPSARLRAYIENAFKGTPSDHTAWVIWLESLRVATKADPVGDRLGALAAEVQEGWLEVLREIVREGVQEGDFADVDVDAGAEELFAAINGLALAEVLRGRTNLDAAMHRAQDAAHRLLS